MTDADADADADAAMHRGTEDRTSFSGSEAEPLPQPLDQLARPLSNLRVSVTDRCNLRCQYCMPEPEYVWLPREDILHFEEIVQLVALSVGIGVRKVRLTGGEPLLRRNLDKLIHMLAGLPGLVDIALTTNGVLLDEAARPLRDAGLHRLTVSLDTLKPERFRTLTGRDLLPRTLAGLRAACDAGLSAGLKLNTVLLRGFNEDEILDLIAFARDLGAELRFIEYMDVGGATRWSAATLVSKREILQRLTEHYGSAEPLADNDWAPAERFRLADGTVIGIVASATEPFCSTCDRARLTADGTLYTCLYASRGLDLRGPLRSGHDPQALRDLVRRAWLGRQDRGAEQRLELQGNRGPLIGLPQLRQDPHLEMHTRGG